MNESSQACSAAEPSPVFTFTLEILRESPACESRGEKHPPESAAPVLMLPLREEVSFKVLIGSAISRFSGNEAMNLASTACG